MTISDRSQQEWSQQDRQYDVLWEKYMQTSTRQCPQGKAFRTAKATERTGCLKCPTAVGVREVGRKTDNKSNPFNIFNY